MHNKTLSILVLVLGILVASCTSHPEVPAQSTPVDTIPTIYPDYTDVTVPCNIAPLNFMLSDTLFTACVARVTSADGTVRTYGEGVKVIIPEDEWASLKQASLGQSMKVEVFGQQDGKWLAYRPFQITVSKDSIDPYISYRLIEPGYGLYDKMNISQRCVTNFEERVIFNNQVACGEKKGQCINCHSYQNYHTSNMLFHVRVTNGGTILVRNGKAGKINLKRDGILSAGVYPSWHPTLPLVAFSVDLTHQYFHTSDVNKVEVFDDASDLILYDVDQDKITTICADSTRLEVFPTWSPDGKYLYYCSTDAWRPDSTNNGDYRLDYPDVHYNLYRRAFQADKRQFGPEELVYDADSLGRSVSLPRISPDGKFVTVAEGDYGYFNIWHHEADIRILDTKSFRVVPSEEMNSPRDPESYPSFSSNGRWIMCASRRDDGNYSRVYFAYFDGKKAHKAFLLPQADPEHNWLRLLSYNRPEYMVEPVPITLDEFANIVKKE